MTRLLLLLLTLFFSQSGPAMEAYGDFERSSNAPKRPHRELVDDFKSNPNDWERRAAQVGQTQKGRHKGSTNVETQWRNKKTGEELSTHEVFDSPRGNPHPENVSPNLPDGGSIRPIENAKELP